jgi:hypothetical protein
MDKPRCLQHERAASARKSSKLDCYEKHFSFSANGMLTPRKVWASSYKEQRWTRAVGFGGCGRASVQTTWNDRQLDFKIFDSSAYRKSRSRFQRARCRYYSGSTKACIVVLVASCKREILGAETSNNLTRALFAYAFGNGQFAMRDVAQCTYEYTDYRCTYEYTD